MTPWAEAPVVPYDPCVTHRAAAPGAPYDPCVTPGPWYCYERITSVEKALFPPRTSTTSFPHFKLKNRFLQQFHPKLTMIWIF